MIETDIEAHDAKINGHLDIMERKISFNEAQIGLLRELLDKSGLTQKLQDGNKEENNPIIGNRIVCDKTFAVRLSNFLNGVKVCDCVSSEELDYLKMVAKKLLDYQKNTVVEEDEKLYLKTALG